MWLFLLENETITINVAVIAIMSMHFKFSVSLSLLFSGIYLISLALHGPLPSILISALMHVTPYICHSFASIVLPERLFILCWVILCNMSLYLVNDRDHTCICIVSLFGGYQVWLASWKNVFSAASWVMQAPRNVSYKGVWSCI